MKKRLISTLLTLTLGVSVLAGCGNAEGENTKEDSSQKENEQSENESESEEEASYFNETGYPICDEPLKITVSGTSGTEDWNNTDLVQWIKSEMGIEMECTPYNLEAWENQFTLLLAGEDLPDLILGVGRDVAEVNSYGPDYFLPLDEYLDYMPNLKAWMEKYPDYKTFLTAEDGHIYGLSMVNTNPVVLSPRTFINQVWLDNVGMEAPESINELYEVLKAFKEQDANGNGDADDEIPLSGDFRSLRSFMPWFGMYTNKNDYSPLLDESGNVYLAQTTENYKEMLRFLNKLYEEGLYDVDGLVQSEEERKVKFAEDRAGMITTDGAPFTEAGKDITYDKNWSGVVGLTSDYSDRHVKVHDFGITSNIKVVVNAETQYPEAICRMLDYFFTDEGIVAACEGVQDVSWRYSDQEFFGYPIMDSSWIHDGYESKEEYRWKKGTINGVLNFGNMPASNTMILATVLTDEQVYSEEMDEYIDWSVLFERARRKSEVVDDFPTLVYNSEENDRRSALVTDMKMYVKQAFSQFVIGELDIDGDWDSYISTLESIGHEELLEIEQTAYDRQYK